MDPIGVGPSVQDSLAMADPLAVLVLLGAVAAAASLSVNEGGAASSVPASPGGPAGADNVVRAWLDSLAAPPLKR